MPEGGVRVAIVNDYEVVVQGVRRLLAGRPGVAVVEVDCLADPMRPVDIVLFDTFAPARDPEEELRRLVARPNVGRVVVYTWDLDPTRVRAALAAGASACLSKTLGGDALAAALVRVHAGERLVSPWTGAATDAQMDAPGRDWPAREHGLSSREAEVLGLVTQGKTNADIAAQLYLSPNSVKTYIRTAYRKIGVERRSQAVAWGHRNGLAPELVVDVADQPT